MKNIAKILCFVLSFVLVFSVIGISTFAESAVVVTMAAELKEAVENGGEVKLGGNITTTEAFKTSGVTTVVDLNGKTLTIGAGDNKFVDASNITFKNGTINITGVTVAGNAVFCLDEYEETLVSTLTLENVDLVGDGYSSAYGIFYVGDSSELKVSGGNWTLANDTHASGGIFKADSSDAKLTIEGLELEAHNVRRLVTYLATTITDSSIAISGDADGIDAEMEHGFNRSPLTITNSTLTMENMIGRGITAQNGDVVIVNSDVSIVNVKEATIDVRNGKTVSVDADSSVVMNGVPVVADGCAITGNVYYGTLEKGFTSENGYWGECRGNAKESFVINFYVDNDLVGSASLNNKDGIIDGDVTATWSIGLVAESDEWWTLEWYTQPNVYYMPNRVEQVIDGVVVAEGALELNGPDSINKIVAIAADDYGYIEKFYTSLSKAIEENQNGTIYLVADVTESIESISNIDLQTIVTEGVTITSTYTDSYVDFDNVILGECVTINVESLYSGGSENDIYGNLNVKGEYYHSYNANTGIYSGSNVTVGHLNIADNDDVYSGIFVYGTLECDKITLSAGQFYVEFATLECDEFVCEVTSGVNVYVADSDVSILSANINPLLDFKAVDNGNGAYTIVDKHYVAEANGLKYESLQEAINAGGTVVLVDDVVLEPQEFNKYQYGNGYCGLVVADGHTVTIDLAGYSITYTDTFAAINNCMIVNIGNLTIKDSVGGGAITYYANANGGATNGLHTMATVLNLGSLVIEGGKLENIAPDDSQTTAVVDNHSMLAYDKFRNTVSLVVNGGELVSSNFYAIRLYTHYNISTANDVVINGGSVSGILFNHGDSWYNGNASNPNVCGNLTINGGVITTVETASNTYVALTVKINNPDAKNLNVTVKGGLIDAVSVSVQRGVRYVDGVYTNPEEDGTRNIEWAASKGGVILGGTFVNIGVSDDVVTYAAGLLASNLKFAKDAQGTYTVTDKNSAPNIGANGNWWIGDVDTGVIAVPSITIEDGFWFINGECTWIVAEAKDGYNPAVSIGDDGYWYIDYDGNGPEVPVKTTVKAQALDGVGIKCITLDENASDAFVSVYVIELTNGLKTTFTVNNGTTGSQGAPGVQGPEGPKGDKGDQGIAGAAGDNGSTTLKIATILAVVCVVTGIVVLGCRIFKRNPFAL